MTTAEISTQQGTYIHANGLDIYYEEYGSGEPLLMLHPGFHSHTVWQNHDPLIPILAQHFRMIAPDSRGHDRTRNPSNTMSWRLLADDMAAFIRALGLQRPFVYGFSDGGLIEYEMAMNYPQLAKAYVISGAFYKWTPEYLPFLHKLGIDGPGVVNSKRLEQEYPEMLQVLLEHLQQEEEEPGYWKRHLLEVSYMWATPWHHTDEELKKISEPTLLLAGDQDDLGMPMEQIVHMYRTLPHAEIAIIPGTNHLNFLPKAELYTPLIVDFLLRQSSLSA